MEGADMVPIPKTMLIPTLFLVCIWSLQIMGIGSMTTMESDTKLDIAV